MVQMALALEEQLPEVQESLFGTHRIMDVREEEDVAIKLEEWLGDETVIAFDLETVAPKEADINTPNHADSAQVVICALAHRHGALVLTCPYQEEVQRSDDYWRPVFLKLKGRTFIVHNASYDMQFVYRIGGYIPDIIDTMALYGLVTPGREILRLDNSQSLASAVSNLFGYRMDKSVRESFSAEQFNYITVEQCRYAAEDALWTYYLAAELSKQIERDGITHIAELECQLTPVLVRMKLTGVMVDIGVVEKYAGRISEIEAKLEERLYDILERDDQLVLAYDDGVALTVSDMVKMIRNGQGDKPVRTAAYPRFKSDGTGVDYGKLRTVGEIVNVRSHQLWKVYLSAISGGRILSSESKNLETFLSSLNAGAVRTAYPESYNSMISDLLQTLLDYRAVSKINNTYLKSWRSLHHGGRVHTTFVQTYAESGRLSSRHPNLQNCPRPDTTQFLEKYLGEPLDMRSMFVAPPGMVLITADYSQYELRVAAERAEEYRMIDVYQQEYQVRTQMEELLKEYGYHPWDHVELEDERYLQIKQEMGLLDFHRRNAALIFNKPLEEVTKQERTEAKAISFGVLYGMQAQSLADTIHRLTGRDISIDQAQKLLDAYFNTYRNLKRYIDKTVHFAYHNRYVTSLLGRKRWCSFPSTIPDKGIHALLQSYAANIEREAVNHTIQSTNADATKLALVLLDRELQSRGYDIRTTYPVLTVHDEIVVQAPEPIAHEVAYLLRDCMVQGSVEAGMRIVPTVVEVAIGPCWSK